MPYNRPDLIQALETERDSRVICYFTGDRENQEAYISGDALPVLAQHLNHMGEVDRLDLLLYSRGGDTLAGFALANSLREFSCEVNVLIPFRAYSCATLIALSANRIVAGPFAQLSPIDPSITSPHGPRIAEGDNIEYLPVSVEDVANYFELVRKEAGLRGENHLASVVGHLAQQVNPLALGAVYRAREQIGMLANKLLALHSSDTEINERIVRQLTRELLSHDYIISRREAKDIGLSVVNATAREAELMWNLYEDIAQAMHLREPWPWGEVVPESQILSSSRAVLQSRDLKHEFISQYEIIQLPPSETGGTQWQAQPIHPGSWQEIQEA